MMTKCVQDYAENMVTQLHALADEKRREGERKYFKYTINNIGVTLPQIQSVEREIGKPLAKTWDVADAIALCDELLGRRVFEYTLCGLTFLARFAMRMGPAHFVHCERWLENDWCDNWAAVDHLCPHVLSPIVERHPELAERVRTWARSANRWVRRGSAVIYVLPARNGSFLDSAYEIAEILFADKSDDLVQKGNGWMLRECGVTDQDRLAAFLLKHGPGIPRTTLRYAVEKFAPERRAEVLAATRR